MMKKIFYCRSFSTSAHGFMAKTGWRWKKFFFLVLWFECCFLCVLSQSNVYHPFPDSGAVWKTATIDVPQCPDNPCLYIIDKLGADTVFQNLHYRKLLEGHLAYDGSYTPPFFGALLIRDDTIGRKVYIRDIMGAYDILLYDFSLEVGDTIPDSYGGSGPINGVYVTAIDSILLGDGTYRKRFKLNSYLYGSYPDSLFLIEGIGYTSGFGITISQEIGFEGGYHLACFSSEVSTLYNFAPLGLQDCSLPSGIGEETLRTIKLFPNPTTNEININAPDLINGTIRIINSLGQLVAQQPYELDKPINLINLPVGFYSLLITTDKKRYAATFVKQ